MDFLWPQNISNRWNRILCNSSSERDPELTCGWSRSMLVDDCSLLIFWIGTSLFEVPLLGVKTKFSGCCLCWWARKATSRDDAPVIKDNFDCKHFGSQDMHELYSRLNMHQPTINTNYAINEINSMKQLFEWSQVFLGYWNKFIKLIWIWKKHFILYEHIFEYNSNWFACLIFPSRSKERIIFQF